MYWFLAINQPFLVDSLILPSFSVSVEQQVDITWIQMTLDVSTEVVGEVLHSSTCRPWHDPQYCTSIQELGINFCMSPFHFYFQSILKNCFRLRYFHGSNIIKHWCRSGGSFMCHQVPCVIVSLTTLQGHSSGIYHLSAKYLHVVHFTLPLNDYRHCCYTFV